MTDQTPLAQLEMQQMRLAAREADRSNLLGGEKKDADEGAMPSAAGFETEEGSLFILDEQGRTRRFKQVDGIWHRGKLAHCVFVSPDPVENMTGEEIETFLTEKGPRGNPLIRADLFYTTREGQPATPMPFGFGSAFPRPEAQAVVIFFTDINGERFESTGAMPLPALGFTPIEKTSPDQFGVTVGKPITRIFTSVDDLAAAFAAAGVTDPKDEADNAATLERSLQRGMGGRFKDPQPQDTYKMFAIESFEDSRRRREQEERAQLLERVLLQQVTLAEHLRLFREAEQRQTRARSRSHSR